MLGCAQESGSDSDEPGADTTTEAYGIHPGRIVVCNHYTNGLADKSFGITIGDGAAKARTPFDQIPVTGNVIYDFHTGLRVNASNLVFRSLGRGAVEFASPTGNLRAVVKWSNPDYASAIVNYVAADGRPAVVTFDSHDCSVGKRLSEN